MRSMECGVWSKESPEYWLHVVESYTDVRRGGGGGGGGQCLLGGVHTSSCIRCIFLTIGTFVLTYIVRGNRGNVIVMLTTD